MLVHPRLSASSSAVRAVSMHSDRNCASNSVKWLLPHTHAVTLAWPADPLRDILDNSLPIQTEPHLHTIPYTATRASISSVLNLVHPHLEE